MSRARATGEVGQLILPCTIGESSELYRTRIPIGFTRTCSCTPSHLNCLTPKDWIKNQIGVWQVSYESRDVRDKNLHPATFPIALAKRVIALFTHG
jgi:hypothetical protein